MKKEKTQTDWKKKFEDREKKLDRRVNKFFLHFRKFQDESTCPACNIPKKMRVFRDVIYSFRKQKFIKKTWVHNADECFRWYSLIVLATAKNRRGELYSSTFLQNVIERGLRRLKEIDKSFTEKGV